MKKLLLFLVCTLTVLAAATQEVVPAKVDDYEARFTKLNKAYAKTPDDVETLYGLALFYFDKANPMRNLPMAKNFIQRTEECHIKLIEDNRISKLTRLVHVGITLQTIRSTKQDIINAVHDAIEKRGDMNAAELDAYLEAFASEPDLVRMLRRHRISLVYSEDLRKATPESYYHFIETYPGTTESEQMENRLARVAPNLFVGLDSDSVIDAMAARYPNSPSVQRAAAKQKSHLAFTLAGKRNNAKAYREFLKDYPSSDESEQARDRLDKLLEVEYSRCRTAMDYAVFASTYPDIPLADKALSQSRELIRRNHDVGAARYYIEHFKLDASRGEIFSLYYSWHAAEGNADPILRFDNQYRDFPFRRSVEEDLERAEAIDSVYLMEDFVEDEYPRYAGYVRHFTGKGIALVPLQRMIQQQVASRSFHAALDRVGKFDICFESTSVNEYAELQQLLASPATGGKAVREFSDDCHVLNPAVNPIDGRLYYTRLSESGSSICSAVKQDDQWLPVGEVAVRGIVGNGNCSFFNFYAGGTQMLLGSDGNIMMASLDGGSWTVSEIPPYPVNTDYIETDAFMLPDGSGLLLASDRPGGQNLQASGAYFHGDTALATDLYYIPYINNNWGTPVNLGSIVNTACCERSPVLSRNLRTLYFISDGRGGLGYGDIYMSTRTSAADWTSWSEPRNIGKDVNTGFSESSLSLGPDEKRLYYSSNHDSGRHAAYSVPTSHDAADSYQTYSLDILGLESVLLRVRVADLGQQAVTQVIDYSGTGRTLTFNVNNDGQYVVVGDAGSFFVPALLIDPSDVGQRLRGYIFSELVSMDRPMPLHAVGFDEATGGLTPIAEIQIRQLAHFMQLNPGSIVEFSVDVAGSDAAECYDLSLERGRLLRDYLNYLGIGSHRIIISAYGNVNAGRLGKSAVSVRFRE